jgi:hypothetical protein
LTKHFNVLQQEDNPPDEAEVRDLVDAASQAATELRIHLKQNLGRALRKEFSKF